MTGARGDVEELLSAFDVFALTSRSEGLPLVVLEAMATHLPVVASAVGGLPDVIERGVTGFLFPSGHAEELRLKLTRLFGEPVEARRVGRAACRMVTEHHSVRHMADCYENLYESVLASRRQPTSTVSVRAAGERRATALLDRH